MPVPSAVSNLLALCFFPASTRPRAAPFPHIYKQAGRHDLKQKICTEAEKSFGSVYCNVPSEFFVLEDQLKAKLSVILVCPGDISPLHVTMWCWPCGSGSLPALLHGSCPDFCPGEASWPTGLSGVAHVCV